MTMHVNPQEPLKEAVASSRLFGDWLNGQLIAEFVAPEHQDAGIELEAALAGPTPVAGEVRKAVPLFQSPWVEGWAESMEKDLPRDCDRTLFRSQVASLRAGESDIVVTGQQPGFLGGPLYTLFKVATVIALARSRSSAGKPTIPVFWSGDDDDDLGEAILPVALEPRGAGLVRCPEIVSRRGPMDRPVMLGRRSGDPVTAEGAHWLEQVAADPQCAGAPLAKDLANMWKEGVRSGWTWSRLARRSILRVFQGSGLIVVSGDDPGLHEAAWPLYDQIQEKTETLGELAVVRGRDFDSLGWHAQITLRSLMRPLFKVKEDRRSPLEPGSVIPEASQLRPGVMLRSPVQDWLLRPAAVVVGPGELAYLRQLDPVYRELGIDRPPLVPRLFAWLLPPDLDPGKVREFREARTANPGLASTLAAEAEDKTRQILQDILKERLELTETRAFALAEGRARRWRKGVEAMLRAEIERTLREAEPLGPAWVFPDGKRQERHLAYLCAASLWGGHLVEACLEAAGQHLELGHRNRWKEFVIVVPSPR
jgi:hypothetical protein